VAKCIFGEVKQETMWLPLTGLSWLPSRLLTAPSVYSGIFPTPIYLVMGLTALAFVILSDQLEKQLSIHIVN